MEDQNRTEGGTSAFHATWHVGRSWNGSALEDKCPCPKEACGLVVLGRTNPECTQHPVERGRSMRQGHPAGDCLPMLHAKIEQQGQEIVRWRAGHADLAQQQLWKLIVAEIHGFDDNSVLNPVTGKPYGPGPLWAGTEPMDYPDPLCVCGAFWLEGQCSARGAERDVIEKAKAWAALWRELSAADYDPGPVGRALMAAVDALGDSRADSDGT